MTPLDPVIARQIDDLANALQSAVLILEHLERTTTVIERDVTALGLSLRRASDALARLQGGVR